MEPSGLLIATYPRKLLGYNILFVDVDSGWKKTSPTRGLHFMVYLFFEFFMHYAKKSVKYRKKKFDAVVDITRDCM